MKRARFWYRSSLMIAGRFGLVFCCAAVCAGVSSPLPLFAAEDDVTAVEPPLEQQRNAHRAALHECVFGENYLKNRRVIDARMERSIREVLADYDLTKSEYDRLLLASRADRIRLDRDVQRLREKFEASKNQSELQPIAQEVSRCVGKQLPPSNSDSFFEKMTKKLLEGKSPAIHLRDDRLFILAIDDIQTTCCAIAIACGRQISPVREVQRHVDLRQAQRQALIDLLLKETQPAKVFWRLLTTSSSNIGFLSFPDDKWKPLIDEDQWPKVLLALDGFREFGPFLKRHGLIAKEGVNDRQAAHRADRATVADRPAVVEDLP